MEERFKYGEDYAAYDIELLKDLYNIRICGVPLSFYILDLRKTRTYCHMCSDLMVYFMEDAIRVEGEIPDIPGDDKGHSWVEKNGYVYDFTKGAMWKKSSYYDMMQPYSIITYTKEQSYERIKQYLGYTDNMNELYIAWIRDMEDNLSTMLYGKVLENHIARFKKEKDLDNKELDPVLIEEFLEDLKSAYEETERFLASDTVKK